MSAYRQAPLTGRGASLGGKIRALAVGVRIVSRIPARPKVSTMSVSIEAFKQAFAGSQPTETSNTPNPDDARSGEALLRLKEAVKNLPVPDAERFQLVLKDLVKRYQAARSLSGRQAVNEMAAVLRNTEAVLLRAKGAAGAGAPRASAAPPTASSTGPDANKTGPDGDSAREITLQFNVQGGDRMQTGGRMVANATVRIADQTPTTGNDGMATFRLAAGVYDYCVTAEGFEELTGRVEVAATADVETHGVVLNPVNPLRADVLVNVLDAHTRRPIEDATVVFGSELERSNSAGEARFFDVPAGDDPYRYDVRMSGYEQQSGTLIHGGRQGATTLTVELQPAATTTGGPRQTPPTGGTGGGPEEVPPVLAQLEVSVVDGPTSQGVAGASIEVANLHRTTNDSGVAALQVPPGEHEIRVTARGYLPRRPVLANCNAQAITHVVIQLTAGPGGGAIILFVHVNDSETGTAVRGASVVVENDTTYRPAGAAPWAFMLPHEGRYRYQISAAGYQLKRGMLTVSETEPAELRVTLQREAGSTTGTGLGTSGGGATNVPGGATDPPGGSGGATNPPGGGVTNVPGNGGTTNSPAGDPPRTPLRDRTLSRRMIVPADFSAFRSAVVAWVDTVVVSERAGPLVDASNLRPVHDGLNNRGVTGEELQLYADLSAGQWRYESVTFRAPRLRGHDM